MSTWQKEAEVEDKERRRRRAEDQRREAERLEAKKREEEGLQPRARVKVTLPPNLYDRGVLSNIAEVLVPLSSRRCDR